MCDNSPHAAEIHSVRFVQNAILQLHQLALKIKQRCRSITQFVHAPGRAGAGQIRAVHASLTITDNEFIPQHMELNGFHVLAFQCHDWIPFLRLQFVGHFGLGINEIINLYHLNGSFRIVAPRDVKMGGFVVLVVFVFFVVVVLMRACRRGRVVMALLIGRLLQIGKVHHDLFSDIFGISGISNATTQERARRGRSRRCIVAI